MKGWVPMNELNDNSTCKSPRFFSKINDDPSSLHLNKSQLRTNQFESDCRPYQSLIVESTQSLSQPSRHHSSLTRLPNTPSMMTRIGGAIFSTAASAAAAAVGVAAGGVALVSPFGSNATADLSAPMNITPAPSVIAADGLAGRRFRQTTIIKEGIIDKWTNYLGAWRARYFIVEPGILKYANAPGQPIKETFPLMLCSIRYCRGDPCRLEVEHPHGVLYLRMTTPPEKTHWLAAILKAKMAFSHSIANSISSQSQKSQKSPLHSSPDALSLQSPRDKEENEFLAKFLAKDAIDDASDSGDEKSPMVCLMENCASCRQSVQSAGTDVKKLQAEMLRVAGRVKDPQFRDDIKNIVIRIVERLDLLQLIISRHLISAEALAMAERSQRRALEKSLRAIAKRNYHMRTRLQKLQRLLSEEAAAGIPMTQPASTDLIETTERSEESELFENVMEERKERKKRLASLLVGEFSDYEEERTSTDSDEEAVRERDEEMEDEFFDVEETISEQPPLFTPTMYEDNLVSDPKIIRRTELPKPRTEIKVSLWSILKDCIGKDLSRISMPVYFNEPTSFLQRLAEDFQYAALLKEASRHPDSVDRMLWVAIFTISPCASTVGRTYKPFNPLLGETFEFTHRGFNFLAEQVGHHPPVTAYHASAEEFEAWGHLVVKNRFTGKSLEVTLPGAATIVLKMPTEEKEWYSFQRAKAIVNNVIFGKLRLEMFGSVLITNHSDGTCAYIEYLRQGWWSREMHVLRGIIFNPLGEPKYRIGGWWSREIWVESLISQNNPGVVQLKQAVNVRPDESSDLEDQKSKRDEIPITRNTEDDILSPSIQPFYYARIPMDIKIDWDNIQCASESRRVLWRPEPRPANASRYYEFSQMTLELNDLSKDYDIKCGAVMPLTDSRYRPDQRWLEFGETEKANEEKIRLEEKQRMAARMRIGGEAEYHPRWFRRSTDPLRGTSAWTFTGEYWKQKRSGKFTPLIDIF